MVSSMQEAEQADKELNGTLEEHPDDAAVMPMSLLSPIMLYSFNFSSTSFLSHPLASSLVHPKLVA